MTQTATAPQQTILTVPLAAFMPSGDDGEPVPAPTQGATVSLLIGGKVQTLTASEAAVALETVNGQPLPGSDDSDDEDDLPDDPSEADMRRLAQKADGESNQD